MNEGLNPNLRKLPKGSGGKTEGYEELPAVQVKNEVIWVNPNLKLPFDLKEGEETNLGIFLTGFPQKEEAITTIKALPSHKRSGLLGRVIFEDNQRRLYRDIDLKGLGFSLFDFFGSNKIGVSPPRIKSKKDNDKALGIADSGYIERDKQLSETFLEKDLRTHRVVAVIKLEEIIFHDEKITIEEAKKGGILPKGIDPVIEVRAFGTKARLNDLFLRDPAVGNFYVSKGKEALLKDAKALVAQELNKNPDEFSDAEYLDWFLKTLGEQVAILHKAGYYHAYLTPHNITLDCKIVDLDSVGKVPEKPSKKRQKLLDKDLKDAQKSVDLLLRALGIVTPTYGEPKDTEEAKKLKQKFIASYLKQINN